MVDKDIIIVTAVILFIVFAVLLVPILSLITRKTNQGFTSKRVEAEQIYNLIKKNGGIENLRYNEFKIIYPEGNNVLYTKLKKLKNFTIENIEQQI